MASNMTDDGSTCPICFEVYTEPKALACLHTFCEICIQKYILENKEKGLLVDGITCPLCRFQTTVDQNKPHEMWAKSLRSNFALSSVLNSLSFKAKSSEQDKKLCRTCLKKNITTFATTFCSVCNKRFCDECKKVHERSELTKNHESVSTIETKENVDFYKTFQTFQRCEKHQKKMKYFCKDEDQLCCRNCAVFAHRECKGLVELSEIVTGKSCSVQCSTLLKEMSHLEDSMKLLAAHFDSENKKLALQANKLKDRMKRVRRKVNQIFDDLENKLDGEIKAVQTVKTSDNTEKAEGCDSIAFEMRRLKDILEFADENGTAEEVFVVVKNLKNELVRQTQTSLKFAEVETMNLSLDLCKTIEDFISRPIEKFVAVKVETKTEFVPSCVSKTLNLISVSPYQF